jgi:hypothetical protein
VTRLLARASLAAFCALTLAGCVDSVGPILPDSQAVFGPRLHLQFYTLSKGYARDPEQANFSWNGARYAHAGGGLRDVAAFTVHPFEAGDFIIQEVPAKRPHTQEYALLHRVADGVYLVQAVDEEDADAATRTAYCGKGNNNDPSPCRIKTREQLIAFARATAARRKQDGALAIRLPDGAERRPPGERAP